MGGVIPGIRGIALGREVRRRYPALPVMRDLRLRRCPPSGGAARLPAPVKALRFGGAGRGVTFHAKRGARLALVAVHLEESDMGRQAVDRFNTQTAREGSSRPGCGPDHVA